VQKDESPNYISYRNISISQKNEKRRVIPLTETHHDAAKKST